MKSSRCFLLLCAFLPLAQLAATQGQTDPVGMLQITFPAESDTPFSLPLHRPAAVSGKVGGSGADGFTIPVVEWSGAGPERLAAAPHYVQLTDGPMAGLVYPVADSGDGSITVADLGLGDLASQGVAPGQEFRVIPYWTLGTLFPSGDSFPASSHPGRPRGLVLLPDEEASGINLPFGKGYFYYDGTRGGQAGWYSLGGSEDGLRDDVILPPDRFFLLRNPTGEETRLLLNGSVHRIKPSILLRTIEERVAREQPVAFAYPVDVSLRQTGLSESPAFAPSGNFFEPEDKLLVYDDPTYGYNPSPDRAYFYFAGSP